MIKRILFLLMIISTFNTYATEDVYTITDIQYEIDGSTKPYYFEKKLDISIGRTFNTVEEVEAYEEYLTQEIENLRIYEDFSVTATITDKDILLSIFLDDAWGIIPFGYPKFDSEGGFRVAARLYWYNSLGSLSNSVILGGVNVGMNRFDELVVKTWDTKIGIDDVLINDRYYSFDLKQAMERESKEDDEWSFYSSTLSVGTSFSLLGKYSYSPKLSLEGRYAYKPVDDTIAQGDIEGDPLTLSYSHGFSKSTVDWIGNFRDGYNYGIGNSMSLLYTDDGNVKPATDFSAYGSYYKAFGDFPISLSSRLSAVLSINNELLGLGSNVRGVDSGDLYGDAGLFSNNNMYIRVIKINGLAEAIFAPHADLGITNNLDLKYGAGGDFILYVDKLKSLVARGSISWDLTDGFTPGEYKIDITSSLFF